MDISLSRTDRSHRQSDRCRIGSENTMAKHRESADLCLSCML
ncbi:hypothetical protein HMPREF1986_02091 [Oribacterium sp. oral taxon 078 str. F0263]|nr:hypothetical protein HMPREF1986_02091 [Oribacterium sp. oral taxon 078 str. F0263]